MSLIDNIKARAKAIPMWGWILGLAAAGGAVYFYNKSAASSATPSTDSQGLQSTDYAGLPVDYQDNPQSGPSPVDTSGLPGPEGPPGPAGPPGADAPTQPAPNPTDGRSGGHSAEYWQCIAACNAKLGKHKGHPCHDQCDKQFPNGGGLGGGFDDWTYVHNDYHSDTNQWADTLLNEFNPAHLERDAFQSNVGSGTGPHLMPPVRVSPMSHYHPPIVKDNDYDWPTLPTSSDLPPNIKHGVGERWRGTPLGDEAWPFPSGMGSGAGSDFFEFEGGRQNE